MFHSTNYLSAAFLKNNQLSNIQTYKYAKCFILPIINLLRFYMIYKHTNIAKYKISNVKKSSCATCFWRTTSWPVCQNSFNLSLDSGTCESRSSFSTSSSSSVCPIISNTGLKHATPDNFVAVVGSGKFLALWPLRGRSFIVFVNLGKIPLQFWHVYDKEVIKSSPA